MITPVALIIFNRPDTTQRVFSEIAKAKPPKLFVIADGPRAGNSDDVQRCTDARAVIDQVDWNCEVYKNYADENLGCGVRPATGISWVFQHVEHSIILEDDILPHSTFFDFCDELLEKYRYDERVMVISGMKSQFGEQGKAYNEYSYGFRRHLSCWGWATWARAWQHFDFRLKLWPQLRDLSLIADITRNSKVVEYYKRLFEQAYINEDSRIDYWDYQWLLTCWSQNGLCIVPNANLTINIGFNSLATHSKTPPRGTSSQLEEMVFPLAHPPFVVPDSEGDQHRYRLRHSQKNHASIGSYVKTIIRRFAKSVT